MTDTSPAEALLPCPFCGSFDTHECVDRLRGRRNVNMNRECRECGAIAPSSLWNTRAALTPKSASPTDTHNAIVDAIVGGIGMMRGGQHIPREEWAAQPLSVTPDDEALMKMFGDTLCRFRKEPSSQNYDEMRAADEALRRHIAGLRYEADVWRSKAETRGREGAEARAALAGVRDKTIEECAAIAAPYPQTGFPIMPAERLVNRERDIIAASIRALKKEPTDG